MKNCAINIRIWSPPRQDLDTCQADGRELCDSQRHCVIGNGDRRPRMARPYLVRRMFRFSDSGDVCHLRRQSRILQRIKALLRRCASSVLSHQFMGGLQVMWIYIPCCVTTGGSDRRSDRNGLHRVRLTRWIRCSAGFGDAPASQRNRRKKNSTTKGRLIGNVC